MVRWRAVGTFWVGVKVSSPWWGRGKKTSICRLGKHCRRYQWGRWSREFNHLNRRMLYIRTCHAGTCVDVMCMIVLLYLGACWCTGVSTARQEGGWGSWSNHMRHIFFTNRTAQFLSLCFAICHHPEVIGVFLFPFIHHNKPSGIISSIMQNSGKWKTLFLICINKISFPFWQHWFEWDQQRYFKKLLFQNNHVLHPDFQVWWIKWVKGITYI